MNINGSIIVIEDDIEDQIIFKEAYLQLNFKNEIKFYSDAEKALQHLTETEIEPFIIFSDINMPKLNGMALRNQIHQNEQLRLKTTPYLFFTTSAEQRDVIEAYSKSIQGFFVKPTDFDKLKTVLKVIIEYWQHCVSPDYVH